MTSPSWRLFPLFGETADDFDAGQVALVDRAAEGLAGSPHADDQDIRTILQKTFYDV
jgi:hypothetical protein